MTIKATLIKSTGDDLVVDAARASFAKTHDTYTSEQNERLIRFLASAEPPHFTPFTHPRYSILLPKYAIPDLYDMSQTDLAGAVWRKRDEWLYFRHSFYGWVNIIKKGFLPPAISESIENSLRAEMPVSCRHMLDDNKKNRLVNPRLPIIDVNHPDFIDVTLLYEVPIFVARQEFKHMVGFTRNERSGRYVTADTEFYRPKVWRKKPDGSIKQGSGDDLCEHLCGQASFAYTGAVEEAGFLYNDMLGSGIAPEMARMVLPQSMMTSYVVTANLTGLARFVHQRTQPDAQKEIQELAHQVNALLKQEFGSEWNKGI